MKSLSTSLLCVGLFSVLATLKTFEQRPELFGVAHTADRAYRWSSRLLVLYAFSDTDPEYINNLRFFVRESTRQRDASEYVFIVNTDAEAPDLPDLPDLSGLNARYLFRRNVCYDWGAFGWALTSGRVEVRRYTHFIFLNSSVRGPFMPSYVAGKTTWSQSLVSLISRDVKLVGPTISCEQATSASGITRANPHVQSYAVATDLVGLRILMGTPVFECRESIRDTIFHAELGASKAILDAGFNIASLMSRHAGVNWTDPANRGCNGGTNPYALFGNDGSTLEAFEVMFVKVKAHLKSTVPYMVTATKVDQWKGGRDISGNAFKDDPKRFKLPYVLEALARGADCFDCEYYVRANDQLPRRWSCVQAFDHFVNHGRTEGRKARWTCDADVASIDTTFRGPTAASRRTGPSRWTTRGTPSP